MRSRIIIQRSTTTPRTDTESVETLRGPTVGNAFQRQRARIGKCSSCGKKKSKERGEDD